MHRHGFHKALLAALDEATARGDRKLVINAGELHRQVGGYPNGGNHRMPICCGVMIEAMKANDRVVQSPPSGKGATLSVEYVLPR